MATFPVSDLLSDGSKQLRTETVKTIPASATLQNAVSATGNGTDMTVDGYGVAKLQITGTFVATITFYGSVDGTNFSAIPAKEESDGTTVYTTTTTGIYEINCSGLQKIRAVVTWTSGTSITIVGRAVALAGSNSVMQLSGSMLQEEKTQADAVAGVVTFSENITFVEIKNTDTTNTGVFTVNGISITVPPGEAWKDGVGGTPGATVTIAGATTYILHRFE